MPEFISQATYEGHVLIQISFVCRDLPSTQSKRLTVECASTMLAVVQLNLVVVPTTKMMMKMMMVTMMMMVMMMKMMMTIRWMMHVGNDEDGGDADDGDDTDGDDDDDHGGE